eukprot:jgi/Mesvir1/16201/Mv08463-RA.1
MEPTAAGAQHPWFTPLKLLALFCVINLLNYVDRGVIASNGVNGSRGTDDDGGGGDGDNACRSDGKLCEQGSGIQAAFHLTNFQDGILPAAFMVGLLVASPIFADLSKRHDPFRLIGWGLSIWTAAATGCGLATSFVMMTLCRMAVGVGEASFVSLAAPFIDDYAPPEQRTQWLALFYMCIPSGIALGYILGGLVATATNWRAPFFLEAALMLPFAAFYFIATPVPLRTGMSSSDRTADAACSDNYPSPLLESPWDAPASTSVDVADGPELGPDASEKQPWRVSAHGDSSGGGGQESSGTHRARGGCGGRLQALREQGASMWGDLRKLGANALFVAIAGGNVAYTCTLGAYAYWGPKAGKQIFNMAGADTVFGGVTVITGILGTLSGGLLLDRLFMPTPPNALLIMWGCSLAGFVALQVAFLLPTATTFTLAFALGEFLMFNTQGPGAAALLWSVPPGLRAPACALVTVVIHLFGDVPSPPLVGLLQDRVDNWRVSMSAVTLVILLAAACWVRGWLVAREAERRGDGRLVVSSISESLRENDACTGGATSGSRGDK